MQIFDTIISMASLFNLFKGRINRSTFYVGLLLYILISCFYLLSDIYFKNNFSSFYNNDIETLLIFIIVIPLIVFGVSLYVRRLHDLGHSGFWTVLIMVPIIGFIFYFYTLFRKGQESTNKYGEKPLFTNDYLKNIFAITPVNQTIPSQDPLQTPITSAQPFHPKLVLLSLNLLVITMLILGYWFITQAIAPVNYKIKEIQIVPIGEIAPSEQNTFLTILQTEFPGIKASIASPMQPPVEAYDLSRRQYNAEMLLSELQKRSPDNTIRQVGIIQDDIYTPDLNFVFSTTQPKTNSLILSLARLTDPSSEKSEQRYKKVLLRALGITFGLKPSPSGDRLCVMAFSNSLEELDSKGLDWCENRALIQRIQ